jgi:hypothetical protein
MDGISSGFSIQPGGERIPTDLPAPKSNTANTREMKMLLALYYAAALSTGSYPARYATVCISALRPMEMDG